MVTADDRNKDIRFRQQEEKQMKRKTVTAFLMSLCLAVSLPGTVCASELSDLTNETMVQGADEQTEDTADTTEEITDSTEATEEESQKEDTEKDSQEESQKEDTEKDSQKESQKEATEKNEDTVTQTIPEEEFPDEEPQSIEETGEMDLKENNVDAVQGAHTLTTSVATVMEQTRKYMQSVDQDPTFGSEWFIIGLARSGVDTNSVYFKNYYNNIVNYLKEHKGKLSSDATYKGYAEIILAMTSMGKDARAVAGYNLFEPLADFEVVTGQGTDGTILTLLALHSNPAYSIPQVKGVKVQTTEQKLIEDLLEKETKEGGWSIHGDTVDPGLTGMALQALAPYDQIRGYEKVTEAVDRALDVLSSMQNQDGGYSTMGEETSETAAQILMGLCELGIDPMQDERFIKGGSWIVENLITYHIAGNGFLHKKADAGNTGNGVDGAATEQSYCALTAYQRLLDKKTSLYDMSDMKLTADENSNNEGTDQEKSDNKKDDNTTGKTENKSDTNTKSDKTTTTKKKLTSKGKKLTLSSRSGKKLSLTGSTSKKLSLTGSTAPKKLALTSGTNTDTEGSVVSLDEVQKEETGDEENSKKLTLADTTADGMAESSAVTATENTDVQMEQGASLTNTGVVETSGRQSVGIYAGIVAIGVLAAVGGIWLYLRKKKK